LPAWLDGDQTTPRGTTAFAGVKRGGLRLIFLEKSCRWHGVETGGVRIVLGPEVEMRMVQAMAASGAGSRTGRRGGGDGFAGVAGGRGPEALMI